MYEKRKRTYVPLSLPLALRFHPTFSNFVLFIQCYRYPLPPGGIGDLSVGEISLFVCNCTFFIETARRKTTSSRFTTMAKDNQWNFVDDESEACDAMLAPPPARSASDHHAERMWQFQVLMNDDMAAGEKLAVVGNCDALGNWQLGGGVLLSKDDEGM